MRVSFSKRGARVGIPLGAGFYYMGGLGGVGLLLVVLFLLWAML